MSLFKKPNKNIRRREIEINDDDTDNKEEVDISAIKLKQRNSIQVITSNVKQTLLSFGEEWDEADDGEVFKVKKSLQSRKIRRQADKEREEKRKKHLYKQNRKGKIQETEKIITTDDQVTIKIKNPIAGPAVSPTKILTGLSAEMADYRSDSDEEENVPHHKFSQPDQVKMLLKSGRIPDAALIHAARKRRQEAREMGITIPDYINGNSENLNNNTKIVDNFSRLVREDDNEFDDDEERISMAGIVSFKADRARNKEGLDTYLLSEPEDDKDEWEAQQIRKAVSDARLAAVQQESYYMQYMNNAAVAASSMQQMTLNNNPVTLGPVPVMPPLLPTVNEPTIISPSECGYPLSIDVPNHFLCSDSTQICKNLRNRLEKLTEVYNNREAEQKKHSEELNGLFINQKKRKCALPGLAERFQFYQDLRGYIIDLVECLDEKVPLINSLEQRLINMYQKRATELINRRRQDVKDQVEELTSSMKGLVGVKRDDERIRRAAEREGRRIRRSKNRDLLTPHIDGMSSDDEITEMTAAAYRNQKEIMAADTKRVYEDVVDDFATIDSVLRYFSEWRKLDKTAYVEAYASICLPKLLGPIVRMHMLMWNPLNDEDIIYFESLDWVKSVTMYAADTNETIDTLSTDPDLQLLPKLIDKIVIPKLEQILKAQWDPLSNVETRRLTSMIRLLLEYPGIGPKSKSFTELINTVISRMKDCVENDVFIPLFPKQTADNSRYNVFFNRQFMMTVKLFGNVLNWYSIINETILIDIAITSLLNRYLLMAIRMLPPLEAASKCLLVTQHLPSFWLQTPSNFPSQLSQFLDCIRLTLPKLDLNKSVIRDTFDRLISLTKNL